MYHDYSTAMTLRSPGEPSELAKARELLANESRKLKKQRPDRHRVAAEAFPSRIDPRTAQFLHIT